MILLSVLPAILLLILICMRSPNKVPTRWIVIAFIFGIISTFLSVFPELGLDYIHDEYLGHIPVVGPAFRAFVVAAIPEECCKLLMLWLIINMFHFVDDYTDSLLLSVAVGLGFAAIENVFYVTDGGSDWFSVALLRGLISVPGHYAFAVLMGFFYSLYYFDEDRFRRYRWLILVAPVMAHGIYDAILMLMEQSNDSIKNILSIVFFVFISRLHKYCQLKLKSLVQRDVDADHIEKFRQQMLKRKMKI